MIAIDFSKQQALDADPRGIRQVNFTKNLAQQGNANTIMSFIIEEAKRTILNFSQGTVIIIYYSLLLEYYNFILFYCNINIKWLNIRLWT